MAFFPAGDNVLKNNLDTGNPVTSGTDYVAEDDGYVMANIKGNQSLAVSLYGATNNNAVYLLDYTNPYASGMYLSWFVKKGMRIRTTYTSAQGSVSFKALI